VETINDLVAATRDGTVRQITVSGPLVDAPSITLLPEQSLRGAGARAGVSFTAGSDGLRLTSDNRVHGIHLNASADKRAIFNDTSVASLGSIELVGVTTHGCVQILASGAVRAGHVEVNGLDIVAADARPATDRPHGFNVDVIQGAFTLWNMQPEEDVVIGANLVGLSAGRPGAPVRGSGIFVSGAGQTGGRLTVKRLITDAIYNDGGIVPGTADKITGGVFTGFGADVDMVRNRGPITTRGANDMVLDNWGAVDRWTADANLTSHGPSGIGFVNFGTVNELKINAPIETFGEGARGFNVSSGTIRLAEFDRVTTHAGGAIGMQITPADRPARRAPRHRDVRRHRSIAGQGPFCSAGRHRPEHQARRLGPRDRDCRRPQDQQSGRGSDRTTGRDRIIAHHRRLRSVGGWFRSAGIGRAQFST